VLITMDSSMVYQQKIERYAIAVIALRAASNRLADTRPLMPALLSLLSQIKPGDSDVSSLSTSQQQLVTTTKLGETNPAREQSNPRGANFAANTAAATALRH